MKLRGGGSHGGKHPELCQPWKPQKSTSAVAGVKSGELCFYPPPQAQARLPQQKVVLVLSDVCSEYSDPGSLELLSPQSLPPSSPGEVNMPMVMSWASPC